MSVAGRLLRCLDVDRAGMTVIRSDGIRIRSAREPRDPFADADVMRRQPSRGPLQGDVPGCSRSATRIPETTIGTPASGAASRLTMFA